jgi:hypothetical protein
MFNGSFAWSVVSAVYAYITVAFVLGCLTAQKSNDSIGIQIRYLKPQHWIKHFHSIPARADGLNKHYASIGPFCCGVLTLLFINVVPKRCWLTLKGRRVMMRVSFKSTLSSPFSRFINQ